MATPTEPGFYWLQTATRGWLPAEVWRDGWGGLWVTVPGSDQDWTLESESEAWGPRLEVPGALKGRLP